MKFGGLGIIVRKPVLRFILFAAWKSSLVVASNVGVLDVLAVAWLWHRPAEQTKQLVWSALVVLVSLFL